MLILADSDTFGIDFYQFCQWVHQPASDTDGTPYGHIIFRKLIPGNL